MSTGAYYSVHARVCPGCGRARLEDGRRKAVVLVWSTPSIAKLACRACRHSWRLPVRRDA